MRLLAMLSFLVGGFATVRSVWGWLDGGDPIAHLLLAGAGLAILEIGLTLLRRARTEEFERRYPRIDSFRGYLERTDEDLRDPS